MLNVEKIRRISNFKWDFNYLYENLTEEEFNDILNELKLKQEK